MGTQSAGLRRNAGVEPRRAGDFRLRARGRTRPPHPLEAAADPAPHQAARDNIKEPPAIFVKVGVDTLRGVMTFIDNDLPRAFHSLDDLHLLADLADASTEAVQAIGEYVDYLETEVRPRPKATFRLGRERFEQKLRLDEGISLSVDRLLAIAERELQRRRKSSARSRDGSTAAIRSSPGARRSRNRTRSRGNSCPPRANSCASCRHSSSATRSCRCPRTQRSKWRRRRISSAGRLPACGRRARSRRAHRVRCTT